MAAGCRFLVRAFVSLFFLLFLHIGHAGCCFSPGQPQGEDDHRHDADADGKGGSSKRRKISPLAFSPAGSSSAGADDARTRARRGHIASLTTNLRLYIHRIFSASSGAKPTAPIKEEETVTSASSPLAQHRPQAQPVLTPPSSPCASPFLSPLSPHCMISTPPPCSPQRIPQAASNARPPSRSFAARGDVFPCKVCGEVMSKPQQLEAHQAMKHSLSELSHLDSSMNIIRMIFLSGWKPAAGPTVRRILKIHHGHRALARFEEYRDLVRARAARRPGGGVAEERCIADGNERLRFYCTTMLCSLGAGVCGSPYCCTCSILRHGFAGKQADVDGIATYASGWAAHASLPEEVEREFAFLQVHRAMLVCRVVAGRVARGAAADDKVAYDSTVPVATGKGGGGAAPAEDDLQLLVFNPRAVLPCFVIIYSV